MIKMSYNKPDEKSISLFFRAIANIKRFRILVTLNEKGPMCVSQLEDLLDIEQSDLSHNLKCLLNCKFVNREYRGKEKVYSINDYMRGLINSINNHIGTYENYIKSCDILNVKETKNSNKLGIIKNR